MSRTSSIHRPALGALLAAAALATLSCGGDPVTRVESQRARYSASLNGFVVREYPSSEGEAGKQEILLDVIVRFDGREPLDGLTLDLSMADGAGREKAHRALWVDVAGLERGAERQVSLVVDDLPYQAGDGFWIEVRSPVPEAERGSYRELVEAQ
jgi:hypothetical protein